MIILTFTSLFSAQTWTTLNVLSFVRLSDQRIASSSQSSTSWRALHLRTEHSTENLLRELNHCPQSDRRRTEPRRRSRRFQRKPLQEERRSKSWALIWIYDKITASVWKIHHSYEDILKFNKICLFQTKQRKTAVSIRWVQQVVLVGEFFDFQD